MAIIGYCIHCNSPVYERDGEVKWSGDTEICYCELPPHKRLDWWFNYIRAEIGRYNEDDWREDR